MPSGLICGAHFSSCPVIDRVGVALAHALLVDVEISVAIGVEEHRLAVGGPPTGPVDAVIEGQPLRSFQLSPAVGQFAEIDIALRSSVQEDEAFSVGGQLRIAKVKAGPVGETPWSSLRLAGVLVVAQFPEIRIVLVGRQLADRVDQPSTLPPDEIGESRIGEKDDRISAFEITAFEHHRGLAVRGTNLHIEDAVAVREPGGREETVAFFAFDQEPGLAAVGTHEPDVARDRIAEDDLRPVAGERRVIGVVTQFLERGADDRDHPDALLFLRDRAADQQFGPILGPFDARSTEAERVRNGKRLGLSSGDEPEVHPSRSA